MYNYQANTNGDVSGQKVVNIEQVDFGRMQCIAKETRQGSRFIVYMHNAPGLFYAYPNVGEEWIVEKVSQQWNLKSRSATQNAAILALEASDPGDVILSASNKLRVASPMRIDFEEVTYRNTGVGQSFPNAAVTRVQFNPVHVNTVDTLQSIITVTGASNDTLTFSELGGTYNFRLMVDMTSVTTGRSFVEMLFSGASRRRVVLTGDDNVCLNVTEKVSFGSCYFNIYQTLGSAQTGSVDLKIIRLG